jgi:CTP:molybdopterin cytidylyltransferase MocA
MRIGACILSAGKSERMGRNKALIPIGGETFLTKIIKNLKRASIKNICVVFSDPEIRKRTALSDINWILNRDIEKGPLFSFQMCVKSCNDMDALLLVPVDHPFVKYETYKLIIEGARKDKIVVPTYRGKRGHPTLFPKRFFNDILETPLHLGARYVLRSNPDSVLELEVDDPGILMDIDTPEDLEKALERGNKTC